MVSLALDAVLALTLLWVAFRALSPGPIVRAIVLYIVVGLLAALCWVRLGAVDVALAEAALGSGLTGALLLDAVRGVAVTRRHGPRTRSPDR